MIVNSSIFDYFTCSSNESSFQLNYYFKIYRYFLKYDYSTYSIFSIRLRHSSAFHLEQSHFGERLLDQ